jgi:hypothetical protein
MKRIALSLSLTFAVLAASIPSTIAQDETKDYINPTETMNLSLEAVFEAELTAYAATHTEDELVAYVQIRLGQLTAYAVDNPIDPLASLNGNTSYYGDLFFPGDPYEYGDSNFQFCMNNRSEECRRQYNAELFQSAAVATAIFAGCVGLSAGTALIACAAAALAAHALAIAAAQQRYQACMTRAYTDCALAYGKK